MRESIRPAVLATELCTRLTTGDARSYSSQCGIEGLERKCPTDASRIRPTYANMTAPGVEPGLSRPQRDVLTTRRCGPCLWHHQCRPHALASRSTRHLRAALSYDGHANEKACGGCGKQGRMQSSGSAMTSGASRAQQMQPRGLEMEPGRPPPHPCLQFSYVWNAACGQADPADTPTRPDRRRSGTGSSTHLCTVMATAMSSYNVRTAQLCAYSARSAIVYLFRMLGTHPSDPGSSPGGGILIRNGCRMPDDRVAP